MRVYAEQAFDSEQMGHLQGVADFIHGYVFPARFHIQEQGYDLVAVVDDPGPTLAASVAKWPTEPGKPARIDYEYRRNGTANLFVFLDAHQPWRHVKVTERKTAHDFAHCMRELVDVHYPDAETVRVVLDNLSAHKPAALYEVFAPELARNVLRRLEFHFVPKHASWLNIALA